MKRPTIKQPPRARAKPVSRMNKKERAEFERVHTDFVQRQTGDAISLVLKRQDQLAEALRSLRNFLELLGKPLTVDPKNLN